MDLKKHKGAYQLTMSENEILEVFKRAVESSPPPPPSPEGLGSLKESQTTLKAVRPKLEGVGYTCWGPQAGGCGFKHRNVESAARCLRVSRDRVRRAALPGVVFDRIITRADGQPLLSEEKERLDKLGLS